MEKNTESTPVNEEEINLTQQQVFSVIEYAKAFAAGGYLNPDLISGRMKDITLNPLQATEDMLTLAMTSPKSYEKELQQFSQSFELTSMVYKRMISYLSNMLSFDITYTSTAEGDDYKTPKFKKDNKIVENFLDKFDYKKEFRIVVKEMLRNDAYFACFVDTGDGYVLQELPSEYCKITGRWGNGFLFSFNMYWFLQPGVDLNMYPPFFKKKYKEMWESNKVQNYIPSLPPEFRDKSSWIYWVDVPVTVGTCFKLTPEQATRLPYFTPLFNDLILQPLMRNLQKNSNMAAASKMIVGSVPMLNRDIKATVKDSIAISPDLLGKFMALVKSAISEAIKVASAPLTDIKGISFEADENMYDSYMRTAMATTGLNTNLIFTSNIKPNTVETQLSLNVDEQMMTVLYEQFNQFMEYQINKYTKSFKFKFNFEGTDFYLDRTSRFDNAMALFDKGIVLPQKIAASLGMKPHHLRKQMEESAGMDFMSMLTPPSFMQQKEMNDISFKQQKEMAEQGFENQQDIAEQTAKINAQNKPATSGGTSSAEKGRPKKRDSELGEEGAQTRAQGTNIGTGRGGKP